MTTLEDIKKILDDCQTKIDKIVEQENANLSMTMYLSCEACHTQHRLSFHTAEPTLYKFDEIIKKVE